MTSMLPDVHINNGADGCGDTVYLRDTASLCTTITPPITKVLAFHDHGYVNCGGQPGSGDGAGGFRIVVAHCPASDSQETVERHSAFGTHLFRILLHSPPIASHPHSYLTSREPWKTNPNTPRGGMVFSPH